MWGGSAGGSWGWKQCGRMGRDCHIFGEVERGGQAVNILLMVLRDWAYRNFRQSPVRATLALVLVLALSAFACAVWLYDLTVLDESDLWPIIDVPGQ